MTWRREGTTKQINLGVRKRGPAVRKRRNEKDKKEEGNEAKNDLTKLDKRTPSL